LTSRLKRHPNIDLTSKAIDPNDLSALATQHALSSAWSALVPSFPPEAIHVLPSIEDAVRLVRKLELEDESMGDVDVLTAGSLHLVGGMIEVAGLAEVALSMD
jgi:folylpolyglutamate synthase